MEYKLSKIAQITEGSLFGEDRTVMSVATDSRNQISVDALFVAIDGNSHDGHAYIKELINRNVHSFIVERIPEDANGGSFILVSDTMLALQALAAYHRSRYHGKMVAITGSNGKTIVKEWFAQLWEPANGKLLRSPRSYNSQLGVALSLLLIEGDEEIVFIEAGISEVGEMERLEKMIHPTLGVLTNIGDAHLINFASVEQLQNEKNKLFIGCQKVIKADESIKDIDQRNKDLVLKIYTELNISHKPVSELQPIAMRLELKEGIHGSTVINDSYINDLSSLSIALDYQNRLKNPHKILIFSDFQGSYKIVSKLVSEHNINLFVGIGKEITDHKSQFSSNSLFYNSTEEFLKKFNPKNIANSSVLIKGSRLFAFEQIGHMLENRTHTTTLEIDLDAMAANLNHYRSMLSRGCRTMAMVKARSYGSGSAEVAAMLQHQGVDYLAVAFADEGVELRRNGIHVPIVVLNSDPHSFPTMIEHQLEPEIYSFSSLGNFIETAKKYGVSQYPIHIKLDTGMHRLGFVAKEISALNAILGGQDAVKVSSVFSHLASSDNKAHDNFTRNQIESFRAMAAQLPKAMWHICNTSAIERFSDAHFDMVRLGIGLYTGQNVVSRLKTQIVQIKEIEPEETVGYGREGIVSQASKIATIPIGYADGLNRHLSKGVGKILVNGTLCPIIGNICMDTCMIDISKASAREGDTVIIFGDNPTISDHANWLDTIPYEILTGISSRIKRVYING